MVINKIVKMFPIMYVLLFGSGLAGAQRLKNSKNFQKESLTNIDTNGYYKCIGVYFSDKNYNILQKLENNTTRILKFRNDGYILSNNIASNKEGFSGVIYLKGKTLKIDLIGGTSDRTKIVRTYKVKTEGSKLYLLEDSAFLNELMYYVYELKNK